MGDSGEKNQSKDIEKNFFQLSNFSQLVFLHENPTHWSLETAMYPILAKLVSDIFTVCSLIPRMNFSHTQQSHLCQKNQNYLLEKADLRFFLGYGLRTTIKITIFSTFYVTDNFSNCYSWNSCKKNTDSEITTYILIKKKQKIFCEIAPWKILRTCLMVVNVLTKMSHTQQ